MTEYFKIGKIVAAHGLKGELLLKHSLGKKSSLKSVPAIFMEEKKDSFLPWFIAGTRIKSDDETYLQLEGVDTREAAMKLNQKDIWLPETDFKKLVAKSAPVNLLGYSVWQEGTNLGPVIEVIEQPHQVLCKLDIGGKEVLIPINEDTLQQIDHRKRHITVSLPEGLLDIYLA